MRKGESTMLKTTTQLFIDEDGLVKTRLWYVQRVNKVKVQRMRVLVTDTKTATDFMNALDREYAGWKPGDDVIKPKKSGAGEVLYELPLHSTVNSKWKGKTV